MATSVVRLSAPAAARQSSFAVGAPSALCARPAGAGNACRSAVVAMAKKGKDIRLMITLECTEQKATGVAGISRYTSEKNRRNTPGRIELMKYNKYLRKYTLHREIKK